MSEKDRADIVVLSPDLPQLGLVHELLNQAKLRASSAQTYYSIVGYISDVQNPFGPAIRIDKGNGIYIDVRLPWRMILGVCSADQSEIKRFGFSEPEA